MEALQAGCLFREVMATKNTASACSEDTFSRRLRSDPPLSLFTATACPTGWCFLCEQHEHTQVGGGGGCTSDHTYRLARTPPPCSMQVQHLRRSRGCLLRDTGDGIA